MATVNIGEAEYEFDFANPENQEIMLLERLYDGTFGEWADDLAKGSMRAMTAMVCMLRRRDEPNLKMGDVHFNLRDVRILKDEGAKKDTEEGSAQAAPKSRPVRASKKPAAR